MPKGEMIHVRVSAELKRDAEELFDFFGMNMSWVITAFLKQCVRDQAIPLRLTRNIRRERITRDDLEALVGAAQTVTPEEAARLGADEVTVFDVVEDTESTASRDKGSDKNGI